jgi:hypothetical protein
MVIFFTKGNTEVTNVYISGANPTIVSYNASIVKFYNTVSSLVRFEIKKNIFFYFVKMFHRAITLTLLL